ncbi:hypothetical protein KR51_00004090 [Rubidibacter lacunae KORDI 51-2]|uniref:Uncharacterized protein n=1 Tax=Rubidibacter lacunae KORDI 51-2 TaxID=582515 RepID=U5DMI1_9CHRO|nr:hypothetical protein [Rubidibacter lacunae]ERN42881.1 hypothetical protein KR51_00004090 [Rubidibacter lacunae KORDI 51-2]
MNESLTFLNAPSHLPIVRGTTNPLDPGGNGLPVIHPVDKRQDDREFAAAIAQLWFALEIAAARRQSSIQMRSWGGSPAQGSVGEIRIDLPAKISENRII